MSLRTPLPPTKPQSLLAKEGNAALRVQRCDDVFRIFNFSNTDSTSRRFSSIIRQRCGCVEVWQCSNCTFVNSALVSTCAMCDYGWTGQRECPPDKWVCDPQSGGCSFFNPKTLSLGELLSSGSGVLAEVCGVGQTRSHCAVPVCCGGGSFLAISRDSVRCTMMYHILEDCRVYGRGTNKVRASTLQKDSAATRG